VTDRGDRKQKRKPFSCAAHIFLWEAPAIDCFVEDISDGGAKLSVPDENKVPDNFILILKNTRIRRKCNVIWRSRRSVGLQFTERTLSDKSGELIKTSQSSSSRALVID
jgi:hypothetical protein